MTSIPTVPNSLQYETDRSANCAPSRVSSVDKLKPSPGYQETTLADVWHVADSARTVVARAIEHLDHDQVAQELLWTRWDGLHEVCLYTTSLRITYGVAQ